MKPFDLNGYLSRSRAVDVSDVRWDDVPRHPLPAAARRTLRYMQDIEGHTIMYLRELLSTRAVDDPEVSTFLACWIYEETFHGRVLERFLTAAGESISPRRRSDVGWTVRLQSVGMAMVSRAWPEFVAVHMTWGAINELMTLVGYQRLAALADHPVLSDLLERIIRDESRHFMFYYQQAQRRLAQPVVARVVRALVDWFWAPVGSGVQPPAETRFIAAYLLGGSDGRRAARKIDDTIRRLPGFGDARLVEAWVDRTAPVDPLFQRGRPIGREARQQFFGILLDQDHGAMLRRQKALGDRVVEEGDQRIKIVLSVEEPARLVVHAELRPGEDLAKLFERPEAAGQGDERIREIRHQRLAFMHRPDDAQIRQPGVRHFLVCQCLRNHADHVPTGVEHRIRQLAHQSDVAAAVDEAESPYRQDAAELLRQFDVLLIGPWTGSAEHTDTSHPNCSPRQQPATTSWIDPPQEPERRRDACATAA